MGVEEAERTARLIGFRLDVLDGQPADAAFDGADAVILAGADAPAPEPGSTTYINLALQPDAVPCAAGVYHVLPSDRERAAHARDASAERIVAWHPTLYRYGAEQLNRRFQERFGVSMDEAAWSGWFAVKAAVELALSSGESAGKSVAVPGFDGHKGVRLTFDDAGRLRQPLYRVTARAGGDSAVEEIPVAEQTEGPAACR